MRLAVAVLLVVLALAAAAAAPGAEEQSAPPAHPLGTLTFPTSGSPRAQPEFLRGVAWLHSFGYEEAIDAFRAAQKLDTGFVMAYWGEALAFSQPIWFNEEPEKARAALLKLGPSPAARASRAKTPREGAYLKAVEALFAQGDKAVRARNYADAMAALVKQFPEDDEAKAFYALALLGTMPRGDAALPIRRQAGALVEGVFARNPQHPGAAHYILHAYDHGDLAAKALPAARAYAKIAPAASHALHMPAHAFLQLGLWAEAAATDQRSWEVSMAWAKRRGASAALYDFHSLTWLQYEWTQMGKFGAAVGALARVDEALKVIKPTDTIGGHHYGDSEIGRGSGPLALRNDKGSMRARYIIESERWREMRGQTSFDNVDELFALGLASVRLKDIPRAEAALNELRKASGPEQHPELREQAAVMTRQMDALLLIATGQQDLGFQAMQQAVRLQNRMPRPIGRPYPVKGADELFGEVLLEAGRAVEAKAWFEAALKRTPNRSRAVLGLARATARLGEKAASRKAYAQFLENWKGADAGLPEVAEARKALATP